jgi:TonB family protein
MLPLLAPFALAQEVVQASAPVYPEAAQHDRIAGTVVLELDVAADGSVQAARLVSGLRDDVDQAALDAARQLRFAPLPQPLTLQYAYTFALKVDDPSGQPTPGTLVLRIHDDAGIDLPGVQVHVAMGDEASDLVANDDGVDRAPFLDPGTWSVQIHKVGFADATATVEILPGETRTLDLELTPKVAMETVVVVGTRQRWHDVQRAERKPDPEPVTGQYVLTRRDVESTPGALEDVTRAVHKLPGVASDGDMLGTFAVRGAPAGEVVFLLDRVPLDNPFHLAGFNSIFNPDMLEEVHFYSSAPPSTVPDSTAAVMEDRKSVV